MNKFSNFKIYSQAYLQPLPMYSMFRLCLVCLVSFLVATSNECELCHTLGLPDSHKKAKKARSTSENSQIQVLTTPLIHPNVLLKGNTNFMHKQIKGHSSLHH